MAEAYQASSREDQAKKLANLKNTFKINENEWSDIADQFKAGTTIQALADTYAVDRRTIRTILRKIGIRNRPGRVKGR